ncbi:MAG TPA: GNAT family N-acetyltransferase [Usitatibacteraceae bacterium]|nr:GNAT family N-acetyltransferase [Usitatibacteraceae bacterium]
MGIEILTEPSDLDLADLTALLADAVEHGASVGYVIPFDIEELARYWVAIAGELRGDGRCLLVYRHQGRIVGSAQLELCGKPNGRHRAEVQKVLVHSKCRRMGLGRALMQAAERAAIERGRHLLVLDTESDSGAQQLYAAEGYRAAGQIPQFAIGNNGGFVPTTYMYKLLQAAA